ncbi:MAG: phosphoribosylglycinamide formyltransferase [Bdellovibrionia bacterium]
MWSVKSDVSVSIAILASGRGSNFWAIHQAIEANELQARIVAVVSDQKDALVLSRAQQAQVPAFCVPWPDRKLFSSSSELRADHEQRVLKALEPFAPRFLVLAGYMRILSPLLIEAFRSECGYSRIVNIHPSLLPAFCGVHSYAQAFHYGVKWTGVTVHFVESAVDTGPICAQEVFPISDCQTPEEVEKRGLEIEHRLFPETLKWLLPEQFRLETRAEGRICVCPN